jgi:hypothetical protein
LTALTVTDTIEVALAPCPSETSMVKLSDPFQFPCGV